MVDTIHTVRLAWAFTIKARRRAGCTFANYKTAKLLWLMYGCKISYSAFEYDKQGRLHEHGIVLIPVGVFRKKLLISTYSINFKPLKTKEDIAAWKAYCDKEQDIICDSKECDGPRNTIRVLPYVMSSVLGRTKSAAKVKNRALALPRDKHISTCKLVRTQDFSPLSDITIIYKQITTK